MKVLFAVSTDKVSDMIVQKYEQKYGETLEYKKVYFFDAILRELEKDNTYDSIIVDETLEGKFQENVLLEKIDTLSKAAVRNDNTKIPIILILTPEKVAGSQIFYNLYNMGINNALLGTDRKFSKICELIVKPRTAKEAKDYYVIDAKDPEFEEQVVEIVPENQIRNIKKFYNNLEKDESKYSETFDNIAKQYNDVELLYIISKLPQDVKSVLSKNNDKFNQIIQNRVSIEKQIDTVKEEKLSNTSNKAQVEEEYDPLSNENLIRKHQYMENIRRNNEGTSEDKESETDKEKQVSNNQNNQEVVEQDVSKDIQAQIETETLNKKENEVEKKQEQKSTEVQKAEAKEIAKQETKKEKEQELKQKQNVIKEEIKEKDIKKDNVEKKQAKEAKIEAKAEAEDSVKEDVVNGNKNIEPKNEIIKEEKENEEIQNILDLDNLEIEMDNDEDNNSDVKQDTGIENIKSDEIKTKPVKENTVKEDLIKEKVVANTDNIVEKEVKNNVSKPLENNNPSGPIRINSSNQERVDEVEQEEEEPKEENENIMSKFVNGVSEGISTISKKIMGDKEKESEDAEDNFQENTLNTTNSLNTNFESNNNFNNINKENVQNENENLNLNLKQDQQVNMQGIQNIANNMNNANANTNGNFNVNPNNNINNSGLTRNDFDPAILDKYVNNSSAIFVGTSKSGVSFLVNSIAMIFASIGVNTAILDMTQNKNDYYMVTDNNEELRNIAADSIDKLKHGIADGIQLNRNLTVYTGTPFDNSNYGDEGKILNTLYNNHTVVLIDADYNTPFEYFRYAHKIYVVQTLDILTMQPLTQFMKDLKKQNILKNDKKIRIIINKELPVKGLNKKAMVGGLSTYNSPTMSSMETLFDREEVMVFSVPFDISVYQKYLSNIVMCKFDITGYPSQFIEQLKLIANDVYKLVSNKSEKIVMENSFRPESDNQNNMRRY